MTQNTKREEEIADFIIQPTFTYKISIETVLTIEMYWTQCLMYVYLLRHQRIVSEAINNNYIKHGKKSLFFTRYDVKLST